MNDQVYNRALEIFTDNRNALLWLNIPNQVLGDVTPISLLGTQEGVQLVLRVLGGIEYGVCG